MQKRHPHRAHPLGLFWQWLRQTFHRYGFLIAVLLVLGVSGSEWLGRGAASYADQPTAIVTASSTPSLFFLPEKLTLAEDHTDAATLILDVPDSSLQSVELTLPVDPAFAGFSAAEDTPGLHYDAASRKLTVMLPDSLLPEGQMTLGTLPLSAAVNLTIPVDSLVLTKQDGVVSKIDQPASLTVTTPAPPQASSTQP